MLRENLFKTKDHMGMNILPEDNERSYVITPLLNANPVVVEAKLEDLLASGHKPNVVQSEGLASLGFASTRYVDGHPLQQQSIGNESSIQQIREQRYSQLTPKAVLKSQCGDDKFILGVEGERTTEYRREAKRRTFQQDFI